MTACTLLGAIRQRNGVKRLSDTDGDPQVSELPYGVYGFATPWSVKLDEGEAPRDRLRKINLHPRQSGTRRAEMHIVDTGEVFMVGFISPGDAFGLGQAPVFDQVAFRMFLARCFGCSQVVAVPFAGLYSAVPASSGGEDQWDYWNITLRADFVPRVRFPIQAMV